ncbi:sodium:solute symporter family protein [Rhodohalobacter sp. 614A]|uniref:sodium:solute symporter family protein n=1 Tax=Rhodohalobacter sp. 614A TaxID=2908649 RepID=UPI001F3B31B3|nr:sodium:solute symporter family protein [Rhodohalobacter sp. 614A]
MKSRLGSAMRPALMLIGLLLLAGLLIHFFTDNQLSWPAYISMMVFYSLIFGLGAYAAQLRTANDSDSFLLAGRQLPLLLAVFTMSATWVGGGYINGTAEYTYSSGLVWVQAPWGYAMSLIIGGLFFARKMRRKGYRTLLDPLEEKFGKRISALFFLPALSGEVFWTAAILTALGTTFGAIAGLDTSTAIILSALITIAYTALGGLWAVALTDFLQLILLLVGLSLTVPFALDAVGGWPAAWEQYQNTFGAAASFFPSREALGNYYWNWWDYALLLCFGGIPWQVYFQRVLASRDENTAVRLSVIAGVVCLIAAVPAVLIGIAGQTADWSLLNAPAPPDAASTLPWVIRYLTPGWVGIIGLGAVTAAVMSSADSSILSASSMSGWNVYRPLFKPKIDTKNLRKLVQRMIWIIGIAAMLIALNIQSVYELWFLCSDFVYCLLFPALVCALFDPKANGVGALAGFIVAAILRFGGGDATLGIPVLLPYPMMEDGVSLFPFRTLAMTSGLVTIIIVSRIRSFFR